MNPSGDNIDHQIRRQELVDSIRRKGITDENVLGAIANIPRHLFMIKDQERKAYVDKAFPIGEGQTISQPFTVAYQTQLLHVKPLEKVLEIGTGSGYQAAVLAEMGVELYTIERQKKLVDRLKNLDILKQYSNIRFFYGDGYEGLPQYAPFDKILLTAASEDIPPPLIDQLKTGGVMVLPLGKYGDYQRMVRITKLENNELQEESFDLFSFVPLLKGKKE